MTNQTKLSFKSLTLVKKTTTDTYKGVEILKLTNEEIQIDDFSDLEKIKVGDIIKVNDGSHNIEMATGEKRWGIDPLFKDNHAMVLSNTEPYIMKKQSPKEWYIPLEYLVVFPTGEHILVARNCIRKIFPND